MGKFKSLVRSFRFWAARFIAPEGLCICYKSMRGPTYESVRQLRDYADAMARILPKSVRDEIERDYSTVTTTTTTGESK